jgi:hypothetical protein
VSLRAAARMAASVCAAGSLVLTLYAGRHNQSRILMALFASWVLVPFIALVGAAKLSKRWSIRSRAALDIVTLAFTLSSLAIYGYVALGPPRTRLAFVFVIVPPMSLLLLAMVVAIIELKTRTPS